jgi:hypothetical protein
MNADVKKGMNIRVQPVMKFLENYTRQTGKPMFLKRPTQSYSKFYVINKKKENLWGNPKTLV